MKTNQAMHELQELLGICKKRKRIACYGAGRYAHILLMFLRNHHLDIDIFVVTEKDKMHECSLGVKIYSIKEVEGNGNYLWIVCAGKRVRDEIHESMKMHGINKWADVGEEHINAICLQLTLNNKKLCNTKSGRCFILATGPSIMKQDLKSLKNESVFSCSYFSLLENYEYINPEYYVTPAFSSDPNADEGYIIDNLRFIDETIKSPTIFCDCFDAPYIQYANLFKNKSVYYLFQDGKWSDSRKSIFCLDKKTPQVSTVTIMVLKIAMYMGFKLIYLLGTEHNAGTDTNAHAYKYEHMENFGFTSLGERMEIMAAVSLKISRRELLKLNLRVFNQYHYMNMIAKENDIKIYNATLGGDLDEFERVPLECLF